MPHTHIPHHTPEITPHVHHTTLHNTTLHATHHTSHATRHTLSQSYDAYDSMTLEFISGTLYFSLMFYVVQYKLSSGKEVTLPDPRFVVAFSLSSILSFFLSVAHFLSISGTLTHALYLLQSLFREDIEHNVIEQDSSVNAPKYAPKYGHTIVEVIESDCIDMACKLQRRKGNYHEPLNPAVLNMASVARPGGGMCGVPV